MWLVVCVGNFYGLRTVYVVIRTTVFVWLISSVIKKFVIEAITLVLSGFIPFLKFFSV